MSEPLSTDPGTQAVADSITLPDYTVADIRRAVVELLNGLKSVHIPDTLDPPNNFLPVLPPEPTLQQVAESAVMAKEAMLAHGIGKAPTE